MSRIVAIALNTFREAIRDKVLYALLFFAVALIFFAVVLAQLSLHEEFRVIRDFGLGGITLSNVIISIFIGVSFVYKEIDRKTVFALIPKPIYRAEFILGKYLGVLLTLALLIVLMSCALFATIGIQVIALKTPGAVVDAALCRAVLLLFFEVAVVTAVAVFFSSFTSPFLSGFFTLSLFAIGRCWPELVELGKRFSNLRFLAHLYVVPDLHLFYVSGSMIGGQAVSVHGAFVSWQYVAFAGGYAVLYISIALLGAVILFSRRDFV